MAFIRKDERCFLLSGKKWGEKYDPRKKTLSTAPFSWYNSNVIGRNIEKNDYFLGNGGFFACSEI